MPKSLGERRGPILALASLAAFVLVVTLGLRQFVGGGAPPAPVPGPDGGHSVPQQAEPAPARPQPEPEPSPVELARKRFKDIEALLAEHPADKGPIVAALKELAARSDASPWDIRARMLLGDIERKEGVEGLAVFDRLAARSHSLEAELRFADALQAWGTFPSALHGTSWHEKVKGELQRLEAEIPRKFAEIDERAQLYLARGDLGAARAEYRRVVAKFGIDLWVQKAKAQLERIDLVEERLVAEQAAAEKAARKENMKQVASAAIGGAFAEAAAFRYDSASARLEEAKAKLKDELPEVGSRLERYLEAVKLEKWLFDTVAERYASGEATASATVHATGQSFAIRKLRPDGIVLVMETDAGKMETRMTWDRIGTEHMYRVFQYGALEISARERMALAVFCFHRGLLTEEANELTVAAKLDPVRAGRVGQLRALLDELRRELGGTVRRRRSEEPPEQ